MTIVHVGAHSGQEYDRYVKYAPKQIVWIEADPDNYEQLRRTLSQRGADKSAVDHVCINALIGDGDRDVSFRNFSKGGQSNSIFGFTEEAKQRWPDIRETGDVLTLKMSTLDDTLRAHKIDPSGVDVLVLDIQGAELLALKGAGDVLSACRYIETEVSKYQYYDGGVLLSDLAAYLKQKGFVRRTYLRRPHMNAIFIRRAA